MNDRNGVVERALGRLERWLDGMRAPAGYGGPVVHWWRDCLLWCAPGLDWRYEGIICGYLAMYRNTGARAPLAKARRAGDDLVRGQLPNGSFRNSSFELNPDSGGRPHEAAVDIGLLQLALALRDSGDAGWKIYSDVARRNLVAYYVGRLWDESERRFLDRGPFFVPNKAATLLEALCLLARYELNDEWIFRYVRPTADAIVALQVRRDGDALDGAIDQAQVRTRGVGRFFPFYVARCVPGLVDAAAMLGDQRYLDAAMSAIRFVLRWQDADGGFPQVLYADGRINRYPRWIAGVGDVVRAIELLRPHGLGADSERALGWLLSGQTSIGAFESAAGFGSQVTQRAPEAIRDARDYLPVVGWNDKSFRALAERATAIPDRAHLSPVENDCSWFGERATYRETEHEVEVRTSGTTLYRWTKRTPWAEISVPYRRRRRIRS